MKHLVVLGFLLVSSVGVLACAEDELPEVECTDVPKFADVKLLELCTGCHSSQLEGAARNGAPVGLDYDVYASAMEHAEHGVEEVNEGAMPPGGGELNEADKQDFFRWGLCGTPE
jgi:hypothetical protein